MFTQYKKQPAVVIVPDTTDPVGREIANAAATQAGAIFDNGACQVDELGAVTTAIIVVTMAGATSLLAKSFPSIANKLDRQPTTGCVRVVAIAAGAPILVHSDVRPSAPVVDA